ncbi:MAG: PCMD domain-containing protein [Rikenellaceae bacterium]|nr:PCMD domain-containing protein [Rikenellaceae bacterium]
MSRIFRYLVCGIMAVVAVGCIDNDVPYPIVKLDILGIEVEGLTSQPQIDATNKRVELTLEETTDIRNVEISGMTISEGATSNIEIPCKVDLRHPLYVELTMYQTYEWVISATQDIERYFKVDGQIGESKIDAEHHIARAYVPIDHDMKNICITAMKLGPRDITTYSATAEELTDFDNTVRNINITYHNNVEEWTLQVIATDVEVEFTAVDAWAQRIWLYANGRSGTDLGFKYRKAGDTEWSPVRDITIDGGSFTACIEGLDTMTEYEVIAYSGENLTEIVKVTTEDTFSLPNAGFEEWSFANKCYFPYAEGGAPFWGTGNPGSTTLGDAFNLTTPYSDEVRPGSTGATSAKLQSMYPNMAGIGKFAAGNMFMGRFAGTIGTNGIVHFGRPCTARPVALHGWYKYNCGTIDKVGKLPSNRPDVAMGSRDEGQILIAVGNWSAEKYGGDADSPVAIDTRDESTFFNKGGDSVIGAGEIELKESTDGWVEFTLPLEYKTTSVVPTHLIIVFTGSRFGDYFTGSTASCLLVDDIELIY